MILGKVGDEFDFETEVFDAFLSAGDDGEFDRRLTELGDALTAARSDYLRSRKTVEGLVGEDQ